jgi:hypothetical protein
MLVDPCQAGIPSDLFCIGRGGRQDRRPSQPPLRWSARRCCGNLPWLKQILGGPTSVALSRGLIEALLSPRTDRLPARTSATLVRGFIAWARSIRPTVYTAFSDRKARWIMSVRHDSRQFPQRVSPNLIALGRKACWMQFTPTSSAALHLVLLSSNTA